MAESTSYKSGFQFTDAVAASLLSSPQSIFTVLTTQPLRNTQLLQQTSKSTIKGMNMFNALYELGIKGMYKGANQSMLKLTIQNALFNPALLYADTYLDKSFCEENPLTASITKSFIATAAKSALYPFETILTNSISKNISTSEAGKEILSKGIIKSGFRGFLPEILKQFIGNGTLFLIKDQINAAKNDPALQGNKNLSETDIFTTGLLSSVIKTAVTQPIDTISRTMQDSTTNATTIKEAINVLTERAKQAEVNPMIVFYRGSAPKILASTVVASAALYMMKAVDIFNEKIDNGQSR